MTREQALKTLAELNNSPNMTKHALAAGYTMATLYDYFNNKGKNPEMTRQDWEIVGLLHDADYEITGKSPQLHTEETTKKLKEASCDQLIIDAVRGHCDKAPRNTLMAKAIYAADELTGLIVACALVMPDPPAGEAGKKLQSVKGQTVLKKFKEKSFAAGANRQQIKTCQEELAIPLEEFVGLTLKAMQEKSDELAL